MDWEEQMRDLASRQESLVARFQLRALGCERHVWKRARQSPRWVEVSERVLALAGSPTTQAQRVTAAVLDASPAAALHARSALAWVDVGPFDLRRILVARPRGLSNAPASLSAVHRLRALRPEDLVVARGVVSESALRAIWAEAAHYATPKRLEYGVMKIGALLDEAHRRGLVTWAALHASVDDLRQRGRSGTRLMRILATEREPGTSPTETRLEAQLEEILEERHRRPLRRQPQVGGSEPIGRTDHRDEDLPLVIEVNSEVFHTTPTDQAADERRYQRLVESGFTVGVIWERDVWRRPNLAVETVDRARRAAARGQAVVIHSPGCPWTAPLFGSPAPINAAHAWNEDLAS